MPGILKTLISGQLDFDDKRNFYAASMILFTILNRVFDLGNEVCIAQDEGIPSS